MATFSISQGTKKRFFKPDGQVCDDLDALIGHWLTNEKNQLIVRPAAAADGAQPSDELIAANWIFNPKNQLCLCDLQGNVLHNFHSSRESIPSFEYRDGALRVMPRHDGAFEFFIRGDWNLNEQHQLEFTCGGKTCVIDGFLSDTKSRFTYFFQDKENPWITGRLTFPGRWEVGTIDGVPLMKFFYRIADGSERTFVLPGHLDIDRGSNQFRYTYDKDNRSFGITLLGFLKISETFEITYTLDRQQSQTGDELVAQTSFVLQAAFHGNQFQGDLKLALLKDDHSPGDYLLALTGNFTGVVGEAQVMAGFRFSQRRSNRQIVTTVGFGGGIVWRGGRVMYEFQAGSSGSVELSLGADIRFKDGSTLQSKFDILGEQGQVKRVTFLLGVSF